MLKKIIAPGIYQRKSGLRHLAGQYCREFGTKAYIIGGKTALNVIKRDLLESFSKDGLEVTKVSWYGGEVSWENINRLAQEAKELASEIIVGVGGGKALDTAKAAAFKANLPVITIPTIAATCAAWTPLSIVYTNKGEYLELTLDARNPSLVLVDSEIITKAPLDLLRAGIGDTLAKWFELELTVRNNLKDATVAAAYSLANLCYQTLINHGAKAIKDAMTGQVTPEVEQVIDANILLSGLVSGLGGDDFRSGGAHAIYNGFTLLKETHQYYHGAIVAFGILCQLCLEKKETEIIQLLPFYKQTGLPYTLKQIGVTNFSEEKALAVANASVETEDMANLPFKVTTDMVIKAILKTDEIGKKAGE